MRLLYAATSLLAALLSFAVQPMIGKAVLPLVGATPGAWTTCLMFFQLALLAGYAIAHVLRPRPWAHVALLAAPLLTLPPAIGGAPPLEADPAPWLLGALLGAVGAPFVALATTAPTLQRWYVGRGDPYPLYAASNAGSLAALLAYPVLLEPALSLEAQARVFTIGYALFVALVAACAARARPADTNARATIRAEGSRRWALLAFVPSSLLAGVTTYVSTDVAALPLVWVLPLAIYLSSFIAVFARPTLGGATARRLFVALLVPLFFLSLTLVTPRPVMLVFHLALLAAGGLLFHGELARARPAPEQLTAYYLAIAAGGAAGGLVNALAPYVFVRVTEYPLTMALAMWLLPSAPARSSSTAERERELLRSVGIEPAAAPEPPRDRGRRLDLVVPLAITALTIALGLALGAGSGAERALGGLALPIVVAALASLGHPRRFGASLLGVLAASAIGAGDSEGVRLRARSFFGVVRVEDHDGVRSFVHGTIIHGQQSLDPALAREPIGYYHREGPAGQVFAALHARTSSGADVGVVGLGAGVLATYMRAEDRLSFYELDHLVASVARDESLFTFLSGAAGPVEVVLGDARLTLSKAPAGRFELLVLDAFSSHAIPMHLLTREALAIDLRALAPHGVIAIQVGSHYLALDGVIGALARDAGLVGLIRRDLTANAPLRNAATWIAMARRREDLGTLAEDPRWAPLPPGGEPWTDAASNLLEALAFRAPR